MAGKQGTVTRVVIGGTISGFFHVSSAGGHNDSGSKVFVQVSEDGGCDHVAPFSREETLPGCSSSSLAELVVSDTYVCACQDGDNATPVQNTEPFPCVGDNGMVDCGQNPLANNLCRATFAGPLPECGVVSSGHNIPNFSSMIVLLLWASVASFA